MTFAEVPVDIAALELLVDKLEGETVGAELELWARLFPLGNVERSRVMNALANAKIFTPAQLCATSAETLAGIKNLGATSRAKLAVLELLGDDARQAAEASGPYRRSREVKRIRESLTTDTSRRIG